MDGESIFNDPEIVQLLKTRFIAAAIDRDVPDRGEQDFFRKIGARSERDATGKPLQGMYVATPDGKLLAGGYNFVGNLPQFLALPKKALPDYVPGKVAVSEPDKASPFVEPAEGGLVVNVYAKVLGRYEDADYKESPAYVLQNLKAYQGSIGRDHLWIWKDEHEALVRGIVPESLKWRI